jgi:Transposase, Mutator family
LFDPQIVRKRQRRLTGVDEIVLSLSAEGLTTGEIAAHFEDVFGAKVSKVTISRITDKVLGEMSEWANRPLDRVYPVLFIDALHVKFHRPDMCDPPDSQHLPLLLGCHGPRPQTGLHRTHRGRREGPVRRVRHHAWSEFVPFWTTTLRSAASSARRTPSRASTPASAAQSAPAATSRQSRPG